MKVVVPNSSNVKAFEHFPLTKKLIVWFNTGPYVYHDIHPDIASALVAVNDHGDSVGGFVYREIRSLFLADRLEGEEAVESIRENERAAGVEVAQ